MPRENHVAKQQRIGERLSRARWPGRTWFAGSSPCRRVTVKPRSCSRSAGSSRSTPPS
jgi:hypothetical protein